MAQTSTDGIPTIGEVIRAWRKFRKLSSTELADQAGVRIGYLSEIEHNRTANPRPEYLEKLAAALRVPLLDIHARRMPSAQLVGSMHTIAHPAIATPHFPLGPIGEEIERIIVSANLTEEEEEVLTKTLVEITRQLLALLEAKRHS